MQKPFALTALDPGASGLRAHGCLHQGVLARLLQEGWAESNRIVKRWTRTTLAQVGQREEAAAALEEAHSARSEALAEAQAARASAAELQVLHACLTHLPTPPAYHEHI